MKSQRPLSKVIVLLIGMCVGITVTVFAGAILSYLDPGTLLTSRPKIFGDIKIFVYEPNALEATMLHDITKTMVMTKSDTPFLSIAMDRAGKISNLSLLDGDSKLRFTMTASSELGKWEDAIYAGGGGTGRTTGGMYVDIDFDGHFDVKNVFDDSGKKISQHIYMDGIWQQVDRCNFEKAVSGEARYVFTASSGWHRK